jgi:hypothetical protein
MSLNMLAETCRWERIIAILYMGAEREMGKALIAGAAVLMAAGRVGAGYL